MAESPKPKTIIRRQKNSDSPFFSTARATAQDSRMSFEVRGLLWYLLSKPDDWQVQIEDLQQQSKIGRNKVYKLINTLISNGYMERFIERDETTKRILHVLYIVREEPLPGNHEVEPLHEKPLHEKQDVENKDSIQKTESTVVDESRACENQTAQVFAFYEQNIGELKKYISDELTASIEEYTSAWVLDALKIAVGNQKTGLNYIDSILMNWREHGRDYKPTAPAAVPAKSNSNGKSSEKVVYVPVEPQPLLPVLSPEQVEANRARLHAGKQAMLEALKEQTV